MRGHPALHTAALRRHGDSDASTDDETTDEGPEVNIRSLTRGDGVVIGAAVLLLIASFLDIYSIDGASDSADIPNAWGSGPLLLSVTFAGLIGAALIVVAHGLPQLPKVAGLELGPFGIAFTVFAAWSALGNIFDPAGGFDNNGGLTNFGAGTGLILSLIATLALAGAAVATPSSRPSRAPSSPPPSRPPRSRTAVSRRVVTATRAPVPRSRASPTAVSRSRGSPVSRSVRSLSRSRRRPRRRSRPAGSSRRSGSPCRCRVRCSRRTVRRRRSPNWLRAPGTWPSSSAARAWWRKRRTAAAVFFRTRPGSSAADTHRRRFHHGPPPARALRRSSGWGAVRRTVAGVSGI